VILHHLAAGLTPLVELLDVITPDRLPRYIRPAQRQLDSGVKCHRAPEQQTHIVEETLALL
jgi:hypothetical protein